MRTKLLSLEALKKGIAAQEPEQEDPRRERLCQTVKLAMEEELTERQRECLWRRCEGEAIKKIAEDLEITPPTVEKHIGAGLRRLQRIFRYYPF
ncbi:LuxR C-terminal-related transcriptional regulator [Caproicibacterium sp. BJN0003]|uniref:LuxR C-terminal-related transcriptional regulator n=1 Tax=Caproicibacterium sp. BJN0003 TaxID=2994078 RepID=UPI00224E5E15|nr:sigma factor-like helix-turn-helix DNA-binding protein [Caproicibacterium sp. BJN0003]UZT82326.1 LuxR C-terminal-related transcriptional regulator [Caproicibacterium sp. BJN0003]